MSDFNAESMKAIAERVYPECKTGFIGEGVAIELNGIAEDFNPKLDGNDRERAQALDCIVAASQIRGFISLNKSTPLHEAHPVRQFYFWYHGNDGNAYTTKPADILTASMLAILEAKK